MKQNQSSARFEKLLLDIQRRLSTIEANTSYNDNDIVAASTQPLSFTQAENPFYLPSSLIQDSLAHDASHSMSRQKSAMTGFRPLKKMDWAQKILLILPTAVRSYLKGNI